jgi:hypothetical protein
VAAHHLGNEDVTIAVDRELRTLRDINPFSAGARGVARRMVPLSIR